MTHAIDCDLDEDCLCGYVSSMLLTIDPNKLGCGVALWIEIERTLIAAVYVPHETASPGYAADARLAREVKSVVGSMTVFEPTLTIIERPRIYPGAPNKDLNDLIDVACVGAAVATQFSAVKTVYPSEWKGNVKKQVMLERIKGKLSDNELKVVQWSTKSNNEDILDAIGIGLWHFGRLNQKVYPR